MFRWPAWDCALNGTSGIQPLCLGWRAGLCQTTPRSPAIAIPRPPLWGIKTRPSSTWLDLRQEGAPGRLLLHCPGPVPKHRLQRDSCVLASRWGFSYRTGKCRVLVAYRFINHVKKSPFYFTQCFIHQHSNQCWVSTHFFPASKEGKCPSQM